MQRLTRLLKGKNGSAAKKMELPEGFAQQVLNIEVELQQSSKIDMNKVNRLVELYSIAVQYYETMKNSKYQVFKNKITRLLLLPTVSQTMQQTVGQHMIANDSKQNQRRNALENNVSLAVQRTENDVKHILKNATQRIEALNKLIDGAIEAQNNSISSRLGRRKRGNKVLTQQSEPVSHNQSWQQYLMTPEQIQKWKDRAKNKKRKKLLTVKKNMTAQSLPSEYAIPF